jgi:hypothetical protein
MPASTIQGIAIEARFAEARRQSNSPAGKPRAASEKLL